MACKALGLLEDDSHWNETLKEASICRNAASVRALFSTMLIFCHISDTLTLWHAHKECMSEDILHRMRRDMSIPELDYNADVFNAALLEIAKHVLSISAKLRLEGLVVCAAASSGIAATLLDGGRTAHSLFKLPLNLYDDELAVCNIAKQSATAKILQQCSLLIWDECTMAHRCSIEALDRTLRDLRDSNTIMGGVTFLFVGDFRQTLPVIPKGTRADEVNACLKRSHIWSSIVKLSLTINMRAHLFGDRGSSFSQLLLELGNGTFATHEGLISIASSDLCVLVEDIHTLISSVYPNIGSLLTMPLSWFSERALLAPRNDAVDKINEYILEPDMEDIKMKDNETVDEYITRAKNIAARSSSLGHQFTSRGLSYHIIRGIHPRFGLEECNNVQTPGYQNKNLDDYLDSKSVDKTVYQEMIGSLIYISTGIRSGKGPMSRYSLWRMIKKMRRLDLWKQKLGVEDHRHPPENVIFSDDDSDRRDQQWDDTKFEEDALSEPHLLTQGDLNDLVRYLDLSKRQSGLLGSRLKGWNLLHKGTKVCYFRKRQDEFQDYFSQENDLVYCNDVVSLMEALGHDHDTEEWRLFIDSSNIRMKAVILQNGNK
ncbi:hypothetical protein LAZ67_14001436 [Cordylochernes scorpioides]|uniref:ATP-dependent DNA helicase n=1 Tax=Cordylochernes scorpioides TaxID=51811 RepID=A0ABY6L8Q6_9ARAC|nr:hypothetical protein LAZ67_14001436 [Cordylochernes scorpioides]